MASFSVASTRSNLLICHMVQQQQTENHNPCKESASATVPVISGLTGGGVTKVPPYYLCSYLQNFSIKRSYLGYLFFITVASKPADVALEALQLFMHLLTESLLYELRDLFAFLHYVITNKDVALTPQVSVEEVIGCFITTHPVVAQSWWS